jgi:putative tricarboxylic transport membrane protein
MWLARVFGGATVLALGLAVVFFARQLPYHSDYGPGPGFLPTWIGYVLVLCSLVVIVQELRTADTGATFFQPRTRLAIKVLMVIAIAFLLFPLLGFSVGFGLFICATMRLMGGHRWVTCGVAAIVTAVGIHYLFGHWLDIPLPTGLVGW